MKTTIVLIIILLVWRTSCSAQGFSWTADNTREALLSSNDLALISPDFALTHQSDHLADYLINATGHVADVSQRWVSTNQNLKIHVAISTFDTCEHLAAALTAWFKTSSNRYPPPGPVTVKDLGGKNYFIETYVGPLHPTIETNTKPYRQDVKPKVSEIIQEKIGKMMQKAENKKLPTAKSNVP